MSLNIFYHFTLRTAAARIQSEGFHSDQVWLTDDPKLAMGFLSSESLIEVKVQDGRRVLADFEQPVIEELLDDSGQVIAMDEPRYTFWSVPGDILNPVSKCRILSNNERRMLMI